MHFFFSPSRAEAAEAGRREPAASAAHRPVLRVLEMRRTLPHFQQTSRPQILCFPPQLQRAVRDPGPGHCGRETRLRIHTHGAVRCHGKKSF